ncbi:MAG: O-antigen ligase family protein [Acidobacteriia bacterium]|nr:O-antigen ligase family protein [Terriglobia bacterium]
MKFLRAGICALLAFAVLTHGAVEEWSAAVLEIGASVLFLAWALSSLFSQEEELHIPSLLPPLVLLTGVGAGQLLFHTTLYAYRTRMELQLLLTYAILLFVAGQAYRTLADWRGFVWFVMSMGFAVAVFGILQHLTFNGKLYWFREMRYGGVPFGPYVNRNHFAGLMEMVIPVGLAPLVFGKVRRERWMMVGLLTLLPIVALFLAASRGGIIAFLVELLVLGLLLGLRRSGGKHALAGGLVLLLALLLVSWVGVQEALQRFATLQTLELNSDKRLSMARDTWHIFLDYPLAGSGLGTLQSVFPKYDTLYDGKLVNHAHNDYLEALAETGILGGICCGLFLALLLVRGLRRLLNQENSAAAALQSGGLVGCVGILVHSLVDFNLHIPSNALLFLLVAYLATTGILPSPRPFYATR